MERESKPSQEANNEEVIDSIYPDSYSNISNKIRVRNREHRLNVYHWVVHILSFIIIIPFLLMIIFQIEIPEVYSTIVSVVVGFYFARSLFN